MLAILEKIRGAKPVSVDAIAAAIEELDREAPHVKDEAREADEAYAAGILDLSSAELDALDARRQAAARAQGDLDRARSALVQRLDDARELERGKRAEALAASLAKDVDRQADIIAEAGPLAERLVALAKEFNTLEARVNEGRMRLGNEGRGDLRPAHVVSRVHREREDVSIGNPFDGLRLSGMYPERALNPMPLDQMAKAIRKSKA